jgi:hypothetical protein
MQGQCCELMSSFSYDGVLKDDYIFRLTDDTGILQHSKYGVPDPTHGYTTDDNARALIMAILLYERYRKEKYLDLVYLYLSFLLNAQNGDGRFRNFMSYDRKWLEKEGSEDCFGRCIWALGFAISNPNTPACVKNNMKYMLQKALQSVAVLDSPRAKAYSIIGLAYVNDNEKKNIISDIALSLYRQYENNKDGEWKWFENIVTYCNSTLPWSLFSAYRVTGNKRFCDAAEESLGFLDSLTFTNGYYKPIGCKGWLSKGGEPAKFDEQPVEACEASLAYMEAYMATGKEAYLEKATICRKWYTGNNSMGLFLIDRDSGGCFDGLTEKGVNLNMGAESIISYVISYLTAPGPAQ